MSKIISLQILRGLAATLVAGYHLQAASVVAGHNPGVFSVFAGGEIGVDIFFVLSGFIIFYVAQNRPGLTAPSFLKARFWRIVPPYWAVLTLYVCAALALSILTGAGDQSLSLRRLITSYLLLPYPDHVIIIAWTLSVEILFYIVFALTFFNGGTRQLLIGMTVWVLATQLFLHFVPNKPTWLLFPLHSAVLEFLFGILIALVFLHRPEVVKHLRLPALLLGSLGIIAYMVTGGFHIDPFGREIAAGVPSALLLIGALGYNLDRAPRLETWGESSYILYLVHILYFSVIGTALKIGFGIDVYQSQLWMLLMLISVIGLCYASTVLIERPYQRWYRRFL